MTAAVIDYWPLGASAVLILLSFGLVNHPWLTRNRKEEPSRGYSRRLSYYLGAIVLLFIALALLSGYFFTLKSLSTQGVENAFGFAAGLMLIGLALIFHILELSYRDRAISIARMTS